MSKWVLTHSYLMSKADTLMWPLYARLVLQLGKVCAILVRLLWNAISMSMNLALFISSRFDISLGRDWLLSRRSLTAPGQLHFSLAAQRRNKSRFPWAWLVAFCCISQEKSAHSPTNQSDALGWADACADNQTNPPRIRRARPTCIQATNHAPNCPGSLCSIAPDNF